MDNWEIENEKCEIARNHVKAWLDKNCHAIRSALPETVKFDKFARRALSSVNGNPKLAEAVIQDLKSFVKALMTCAQLGLEPNTAKKQAYIYPVLEGKGHDSHLTCRFTIWENGLIEITKRAQEVANVNIVRVHERDTFEYKIVEPPEKKKKRRKVFGFKHSVAHLNRGHIVGVYATVTLKDGTIYFDYLGQDDVVQHAKAYSCLYNKPLNLFEGPLYYDFNGYAGKTVLLSCLKKQMPLCLPSDIKEV